MSAIAKIGLILGQQTTAEVQFIATEIERQGHIAIIIDSNTISQSVNIEYYVNDAALILDINGRKVPMAHVSGVYWSSVDSVQVKKACVKQTLSEVTLNKHRASEYVKTSTNSGQQLPHSVCLLDDLATEPNMDLSCLTQLLLSQSQVNWVNSFNAIQFHRLKPEQLHLASRLGAKIPATYVGKCPHAIFEFLNQHPDTIVKPVFAGGHTKRLPVSMCQYEEILKWAKYPITLQSYIPGDNIRTYIVGQFMMSGKVQELSPDKDFSNDVASNIQTSLVSDYREAHSVKLIPFELPIAIQQLAIRIMRSFHMQYTAIDWRLSPEGEFFFLEANPAPLFVNAQSQLGIEIDRAIVDLMFA